jgi:hypothetical protein
VKFGDRFGVKFAEGIGEKKKKIGYEGEGCSVHEDNKSPEQSPEQNGILNNFFSLQYILRTTKIMIKV